MEPQSEVVYQLDSRALINILTNAGEFDKGLRHGVSWFVNNAMELERQIMGGSASVVSRGVAGPGLNARDFGNKVIVPLIKISVGRLLNRRQMGNLGAFLRLVSSIYKPESIPQATPEFHMIFDVTEQRLAQLGNLQTVAGGSTTTSYDLIVSLERQVVSIEFDTQEIFYTNDPLIIAQAIARELETEETSWDLTLLVEHAKFCARQPLLAEVCQLKDAAKINDTSEGTIIKACQLENLVCGAVNRNPRNFISLLHTGLKGIDGAPTNSVVVTTNTVYRNSALDTRLSSVAIENDPKVYTYNVNGAIGMSGIATFGKVVPELTQRDLLPPDFPSVYDPVAKSKYGDSCTPEPDFRMSAINMGHDEHMPLIALDATKFSMHGNMSVESTLTQPCVKRLFFTVGTCPIIYSSLNPSSFYNESDQREITPSMVAMRAPSSSYIMDLDRGNKVQEITLSNLHRRFLSNNPSAFNLPVFVRKFMRLRDALPSFNELEQSRLIFHNTWDEKMQDIQSVFDFDPRHMIVQHRGQRSDAGGMIISQELINGGHEADNFVFAINRVCMYNSSPLNMKANELIGVLSSMYKFLPPCLAIDNYLTFVAAALEDSTESGVTDLLDIRQLPLNARSQISNQCLQRLYNNGDHYLPLSDPYCQLVILSNLERLVENANTPEDLAKNLVYRVIINTIRSGMTALLNLFATLFEEPDYSIFDHHMMPYSLLYTQRGNDQQNLFLNIVYGAVLPVLTTKIYRNSGQLNSETVVIEQLGYRSFTEACFVNKSHRLDEHHVHDLWSGEIDDNRIELVRQVWKQRVVLLHKTFGNSKPYLGVLGNLHYSTRISEPTMRDHFDVNYYSGISYLCVRTTRFTGHGMTVMPKESARLVTGNMYAGFPVAESTGKSVWTQCMELAVTPSGLDKLGVYIPNVLVTNLNGFGVNFETSNVNSIIVMDLYNGFTPETQTTAAPVYNILPTCGRYDFDVEVDYQLPDQLTSRYSQCPTLLHFFGVGFDKIKALIEMNQLPPEHSYSLFMQSVNRGGVFATIPVIFRDHTLLTETEIMKRTLYGTPDDRNLYRPTLGLMFADNYVIGKNGEFIFRQPASAQSPVTLALSPKVLGETMMNGVLFGDAEYGFNIKLAKYTGVTVSTHIDINGY
uniref:Major capsid protein n=1 Tax=white sturgeon herpesvirus 2 TaxID=320884 RepID=A0A1I9KI13_9VIRU|nr:major capsid protein [Acipenserid herpesvirus 2]